MKQIPFITVFLICFVAISSSIKAQEYDWRSYLEQLAQEEEVNESFIENLYEELSIMESNPLNLNTVTRNQLEEFPLLSTEQASGMADFLEKNRPLATVFELRNIPVLDFNTVQLILPFFYIGEMESKVKEKISVGELRKNGRNELQFRLDKTLTQRAGYKTYSDEVLEKYPNRKYRGEDFYTSLRYAYRYKNKIQFGITAEKDAGEPFLTSEYPKGFDHYGFHLIVKDRGVLKTLALGDYRLSFGQGLVLNNDFLAPKAWAVTQSIRQTQQPKRHFSTAESGFFRGVGATFGAKNSTATVFYSHHCIDGNLSNQDEITSFKTDGYHRTPLEISKKGNVREQVTGINVNFRKNQLQIGASAIYYQYDKPLNPTWRPYNMYHLRNTRHTNAGIDYSYRFSRFIIAGETAIDKNGAVATLNAVHYYPSPGLSLSALYRYYPISYNALYANAFSASSGVRNEKGVFLGAVFSPFRKITVSTYIDWVRFPWIKYTIDTPSYAIDYYVMGTYTFSRSSNIEMRYIFRQKEKNTRLPNEKAPSVLPYDIHKLRVRYAQSYKNGWNFRTTADAAYYKQTEVSKEFGYMISQNVGYRGPKKISGDAFASYFKSDSYNARLYSYERNIFNTFYMPSFYGEGLRLALSAKYDIAPNLSISLKAGHTRYFDRDVISSGTEQIDGNSRTDVFTYVRWRF